MNYKVAGVQRNVKWSYQGQTGVNQRLHLVQEEKMSNRNQGDDNEGFYVEVLKVPLRVDLSNIHPNDIVSVFYNKYGQVEQIQKVK